MTFSLAEKGRVLLGILPHQTKDEVRRTKVTDGSISVWKEAHVVLYIWEGGRLVTCMSDQGKSPMASKAEKVQLEPEGREPYRATLFNVTNIPFHPHSVFHFLFLLPSLTFLHREWGREKEQRELETGLLDSADHQQLRADAYMNSRDEDTDSCSPTALSPCLVPCCGPGAGARCRNGVGYPVESRASLLNTLPLRFICLGNRSLEGPV